MPRTDILTELKSAIITNDTLTKATADFLSNMQDLKDFHKKTEELEDTTFINYSKTMFSKWTLRELFIFLALFGTDERLEFLYDGEGSRPEYILENIFCYPHLHNRKW